MQSIGTWIFSTGTGTGTCKKVLVAKKKIFLCCWDAAGVATSQPQSKKITVMTDFTTLCVRSLLVLTVHFLNMKDTTTYFVQLQCNWVPIIYAQYLYCYWYWYWYWYLFVEYLTQDWYLVSVWPCPLTSYLENRFCNGHSPDDRLCQVSRKSFRRVKRYCITWNTW